MRLNGRSVLVALLLVALLGMVAYPTVQEYLSQSRDAAELEKLDTELKAQGIKAYDASNELVRANVTAERTVNLFSDAKQTRRLSQAMVDRIGSRLKSIKEAHQSFLANNDRSRLARAVTSVGEGVARLKVAIGQITENLPQPAETAQAP
jgi:hypothetical protein